MSGLATHGMDRERRPTRGWLEVTLLVCLALSLLLFASTAMATALYPYDWGYGEGPLIDQEIGMDAVPTAFHILDDLSIRLPCLFSLHRLVKILPLHIADFGDNDDFFPLNLFL